MMEADTSKLTLCMDKNCRVKGLVGTTIHRHKHVRTVDELKKWLEDIPGIYYVWAYEGEVTGVVVEMRDGGGATHTEVFETSEP